MVIGYMPIEQCLTMLKGRAICQSNYLDMGYKWLKPLSSGKSRKKVMIHNLGENMLFLDNSCDFGHFRHNFRHELLF